MAVPRAVALWPVSMGLETSEKENAVRVVDGDVETARHRYLRAVRAAQDEAMGEERRGENRTTEEVRPGEGCLEKLPLRCIREVRDDEPFG